MSTDRMHHTIQEREGNLYVIHEGVSWSEPVMHRHWWPIKNGDGSRLQARFSNVADAVGMDVRPVQAFGSAFQISHPLRGPIMVHLLNGGETMPDFTEVLDVAEPKQKGRKCATRYQDGKWQKYTAKGWTSAF